MRLRDAVELGIREPSVYAFSPENWREPVLRELAARMEEAEELTAGNRLITFGTVRTRRRSTSPSS